MQELSDEELVASFRSDGGPPAGNRWIDELFSRYHSRVAIWCYRFTGDRQSASDLAQDVFLRAYRSIASFRGDSKFSTWLFTVTRNHCVNQMKTNSMRREETTEPHDLAQVEDEFRESVLDSLEHEEELKAMRTIMQQTLDETEQRVMVLHFAEEIGLDAITRLLDLNNPSGARAYVVSAKRKLSAAVQRWKAREKSGGR
jgi:RNA polymerase sigma-70 factor (ECF subfamily)